MKIKINNEEECKKALSSIEEMWYADDADDEVNELINAVMVYQSKKQSIKQI
jgi:hypothetical protein